MQVRGFFGSPFTVQEIIDRIKLELNENIKEKYHEFNTQTKNIKNSFAEFSNNLKISTQDQEFLKIISEFIFLRTYRTDILNYAYFLLIDFLQEVKNSFNITYKDTLYLSNNEIIQSLETNQLPNEIDIAKRKQAWLMYMDDETDIIFQDEKEINEFLEQNNINIETYSGITELKGATAYKGKVKGIVKIVNSPDDISKVETGDILVANMTFPSYIAAMQRASCFVTDEGGILCHASIVAREMKKPCVIGTKIATKVLKDGMEVEVDADNGVITIL